MQDYWKQNIVFGVLFACGVKVIAFIEVPVVIKKMLTHLMGNALSAEPVWIFERREYRGRITVFANIVNNCDLTPFWKITLTWLARNRLDTCVF
jgi:hypothetical protein